jgi:stalled ribosome rescue protein Dom34
VHAPGSMIVDPRSPSDRLPVTTTTRTAVWLDHREAHVFHVTAQGFDETTVTTPQHLHHRHPKGESGAKEHPDDEVHFFRAIARSIEGAHHILIAGPSTAKLHFLRYLQGHDPTLAAHVVGIETVDHPTDGQLAAYVRTYFHLDNRS